MIKEDIHIESLLLIVGETIRVALEDYKKIRGDEKKIVRAIAELRRKRKKKTITKCEEARLCDLQKTLSDYVSARQFLFSDHGKEFLEFSGVDISIDFIRKVADNGRPLSETYTLRIEDREDDEPFDSNERRRNKKEGKKNEYSRE